MAAFRLSFPLLSQGSVRIHEAGQPPGAGRKDQRVRRRVLLHPPPPVAGQRHDELVEPAGRYEHGLAQSRRAVQFLQLLGEGAAGPGDGRRHRQAPPCKGKPQ